MGTNDFNKTTPSTQPRSAVRLDARDIHAARRLGLLRSDVDVCADENLSGFGCAYDQAASLCDTSFDTKNGLQDRCRQFARVCGFSIRVAFNSYSSKKNEGNAKYVCKKLKGQQQLEEGTEPACPFYINVYGKDGSWKITQIQFLHDHHCHAGFQTETFVEGGLRSETTVMHQRDVTFQSLVDLVVREMMPAYEDNWGNVTGKAIAEWMRSHNHEINRQMASRIKIAVKDSLQGNMEESYQKLEAFISMATRVNKGSHYGFEKDGDVFKRACFFPSSCLHALKHCKPIMGLDGTHLKGEMHKRGVYLVATTKDYNNHIVVIGIALVAVENYDNWRWFLREMQKALSDDEFSPVFISDRQKGLLASVSELFPASVHRFCVRHIIENISKLGHALAPEEKACVYKMARAESEQEFDMEMSALAATRAKAAEYLGNIARDHWVTYAIHEKQEKAQLEDPGAPRLNYATFDEVTSNLSETANNWIGNECRSSKPLHAFEEYMIKVVRQFAVRRRDAERGLRAADEELEKETVSGNYLPLVPVYRKKLEELMKLAKTTEVLPCFVDVVMVRFTQARARGGQNHLWRAVNLEDRECTCRKWQDSRFPCAHAVQVAVRSGSHISSLFDWKRFSVEAFKKTYSYQFVPVSATATLVRDQTLVVPAVIVTPEDRGSRGQKPGPKPKHKRKTARVGSAASSHVAMTQ